MRHLRTDGKWHNGTGSYEEGYWPTEAAALAFARECAGREAGVTLNHDHDEARSLHRIVRAMHDGECPKCHSVYASDQMREHFGHLARESGSVLSEEMLVGWACPQCDFHITHAEATAVFQIFAPFMDRNLAIFEHWRLTRKAQP
jgi:hypothetical protein